MRLEATETSAFVQPAITDEASMHVRPGIPEGWTIGQSRRRSVILALAALNEDGSQTFPSIGALVTELYSDNLTGLEGNVLRQKIKESKAAACVIRKDFLRDVEQIMAGNPLNLKLKYTESLLDELKELYPGRFEGENAFNNLQEALSRVIPRKEKPVKKPKEPKPPRKTKDLSTTDKWKLIIALTEQNEDGSRKFPDTESLIAGAFPDTVDNLTPIRLSNKKTYIFGVRRRFIFDIMSIRDGAPLNSIQLRQSAKILEEIRSRHPDQYDGIEGISKLIAFLEKTINLHPGEYKRHKSNITVPISGKRVQSEPGSRAEFKRKTAELETSEKQFGNKRREVWFGLLDFNKTKTDYRYASLDQLYPEVYADYLIGGNSSAAQKRKEDLKTAAILTRDYLVEKLARSVEHPAIPDPELDKLLSETRQIPEYTRASIMRLIRVLKRAIPFSDLSKRERNIERKIIRRYGTIVTKIRQFSGPGEGKTHEVKGRSALDETNLSISTTIFDSARDAME